MDIFDIRHDRRFLLFCGLSLLVFITMSQWLSTLAVDAADRMSVTTAQLGVMFGLNGFMVVTLQLVVTRSLRRMRLPSAMVLGSLVYAASFFMAAFAGTYLHLLLIMAALTLGELIVSPPSIAMVSLLAPPDRVGRYMGVHGLTASFGWSAGPFIGGLLYDRWSGSPPILWSAIASIGLLAALGFWLARHALPSGEITPRTGTP
jgi:predicted MFS family arabinose efflux permease